MFVVDLVCDQGHLFEGWYDNKEAFDDARSASSLSCPTCGALGLEAGHVEQRPSFKGIVSKSVAAKKSKPQPQPSEQAQPTTTTPATLAATKPKLPLEVQQALSQLIKLVKAHSDDAGESFAKRAIAMHKGDEEPALIHGTSTPAEEKTMRDEGVPFAKIPVPDIDEN